MDVSDLINEWNFEAESGVQLAVELLESMNHTSVLLTNNDTEAKVEYAIACSCGTKRFDTVAQEVTFGTCGQHLD